MESFFAFTSFFFFLLDPLLHNLPTTFSPFLVILIFSFILCIYALDNMKLGRMKHSMKDLAFN